MLVPFKALMDILFPNFSFKCLVGLSFVSTSICCHRRLWCWSLASNCFSQMLPEKRLFSLGKLRVWSNKDIVRGVFPGTTWQVKKWQFSSNEVLKEFQPHLPSPVDYQADGFYYDCRLLVFRLLLCWRGGDGNRKVKMTQNLLFLIKFLPFFLFFF